jgi:hypothetical protein
MLSLTLNFGILFLIIGFLLSCETKVATLPSDSIKVITKNIKYNDRDNLYIYKFSKEESCNQSKDGTEGEKVSENPIIEEVQKLELKKEEDSSSYFKLINNIDDKPISRCTQLDAKNKQLVFEAHQCLGKRKLIVVALGNKLDKYGKDIQDALTENIQKYHDVPFSLVTINKGRELSEEILQCYDIFNKKGDELHSFIRRKINNKLRFGASDLNAWHNLKIVDLTYQNSLEELAAIFYITEAGNDDIHNISNFVGISQKWKQYKVPLTVITSKPNSKTCDKWINKANARACKYIDDINDELKLFYNNYKIIQEKHKIIPTM